MRSTSRCSPIPTAKVATLYDMIHPDSDPTVTVRSVFVIDPQKKIRLILTYPPSTGRNFPEILRAIDSLQLTDARSIATPVNWEKGDEVVISPKFPMRKRPACFRRAIARSNPICAW